MFRESVCALPAAVAVLAAAGSQAATPAAIFHGTVVNQDGRSSGLTAPNGPSQTALIQDTLQAAAAAAADVAAVAVHGTGTPLGDPIEVGALGAALKMADGSHRVALQSVKACFGHTEGAAGMTGTLHHLAGSPSSSGAIRCTHRHLAAPWAFIAAIMRMRCLRPQNIGDYSINAIVQQCVH